MPTGFDIYVTKRGDDLNQKAMIQLWHERFFAGQPLWYSPEEAEALAQELLAAVATARDIEKGLESLDRGCP